MCILIFISFSLFAFIVFLILSQNYILSEEVFESYDKPSGKGNMKNGTINKQNNKEINNLSKIHKNKESSNLINKEIKNKNNPEVKKLVTSLIKNNSTLNSTDKPCKNDCSNNGYCLEGVCICLSNFVGDDCSLIYDKQSNTTISTNMTCLNNCNNNGICKNRECICNEGFDGLDCSISK